MALTAAAGLTAPQAHAAAGGLGKPPLPE